jgi:hypothetical protein
MYTYAYVSGVCIRLLPRCPYIYSWQVGYGVPTCSSNFELVVLCSTTSRISDPVVLSLSRPPKKKTKVYWICGAPFRTFKINVSFVFHFCADSTIVCNPNLFIISTFFGKVGISLLVLIAII